MALHRENVANLARLAKLRLSDAELDEIAPQLESILRFVEKLSELNTDGVEPMTTALDVTGVLRDDVATESLAREQVLGLAPAADEECFRVPPVLG